MSTTPFAAANAYAAIQRNLGAGLVDPTRNSAANRPDFGAIMQETLGQVVNQGRTMDASTTGYLQGRNDVLDVVTAVAETEVAMETLVSVRDKVIAAYEEIMRMPI